MTASVAQSAATATDATTRRISTGKAAHTARAPDGPCGQKQAAKTNSPTRFVTTGLYARLRHPNYLGEIIFQIGLLVITVASASGTWALAAGVLGPLYIVILMYYAAKDQDRQQGERYGQDVAFQAWRQKTSSLLPGL